MASAQPFATIHALTFVRPTKHSTSVCPNRSFPTRVHCTTLSVDESRYCRGRFLSAVPSASLAVEALLIMLRRVDPDQTKFLTVRLERVPVDDVDLSSLPCLSRVAAHGGARARSLVLAYHLLEHAAQHVEDEIRSVCARVARVRDCKRRRDCDETLHPCLPRSCLSCSRDILCAFRSVRSSGRLFDGYPGMGILDRPCPASLPQVRGEACFGSPFVPFAARRALFDACVRCCCPSVLDSPSPSLSNCRFFLPSKFWYIAFPHETIGRSRMTSNLGTLDLGQLQQLQKDAGAELDRRERQRLVDLRAQVESLLSAHGVTLRDLFPEISRPSARPVPKPKYRNPDSPDQVWTGRGRPPSWVTALVARLGIDLKAFKSDPRFAV